MNNRQKTELDGALQWSLRALAQDAETQFEIYRSYNEAADDLISYFNHCIRKQDSDFLSKNEDIAQLSALIASKSGVGDFPNAEAILRSECGFQNYRTAISLIPGQPFQ